VTALFFLLAAAAGYTLGRLRPAHRASDWAHWTDIRSDRPGRTSPRWWACQAVFLCEIAVLLATRPRQTLHAWRHRHDPPPLRSPAPKLNPNWAADRTRTDRSAP
jgi:hypothetical protein